jgi:cysteinyl-tRNA synthetase
MELSSLNIKNINWYNCGPTIYNRSHLGHARTFITFDSMQKYYKKLGYNVTYCMNITDIDDKIVRKIVHKKIVKKMINIKNTNGIKFIANTLQIEFHPLKFDKMVNKENNMEVIKNWLLKQPLGITEEDFIPTIDEYTDFIKQMETLFWDDMNSIGVDKPDIVVKVSDNIDTIIKFIEQIIKNNFAYVNNGSVYIDSEKYIEAGHNFYVTQKETKDNFTENIYVSEKKNKKDFALWKAAKDIDISFDSPWGKGRPGWHVECSAMIHKTFGNDLHIHSGGIDLKFPHHNNECVQSIAYNNKTVWDSTKFLHSGHLFIDNEKMSQSLNNFTTINDFLKKYTPRQLRLMFFMHSWEKQMNLTDGLLEYVVSLDKRFEEFMNHVQFINREPEKSDDTTNIYIQTINSIENNINTIMKNNFDTAESIRCIETLITTTYSYLGTNEYSTKHVLYVADKITEFFNILGLKYGDIEILNNNEKYITCIVNIRDKIRHITKQTKDKDIKKKLFELTDWIRDEKLKEFNVGLEDRGINKYTKWIFL